MILSIAIFVFILFVLVVIHEWGHYIAAVKSGVHVEEFGFGLPPRIWGFKVGKPPAKGEDLRTLWSINALPLGGFVRPRGEDSANYDPSDRRNLQNAPLFNRILVVLAGPFMNLVLGIALFAIVYSFLGIPKYYGTSVQFIGVDSPLAEKGIAQGERIYKVDGQEVKSSQHLEYLLTGGKSEVEMIFGEGNNLKTEKIKLLGKEDYGSVFIDEVVMNAPAQIAGMQAGDQIIGINGMNVNTVAELQKIVSENKGTELNLKFLRNGQELEAKVLARENPPEGEGSTGVRLGEGVKGLNVLVKDKVEKITYDWYVMPFAGIAQGFNDTFELSSQIVPALGNIGKGLFVDRQVPDGVGGPVQIAQATNKLCFETDVKGNVSFNLFSCLQFSALISINLGVFNLLPIPALDGGRFAFYMWELITRKRVSPKVEQWAHSIGFALLILLMIVVTINDIVNPSRLFR